MNESDTAKHATSSAKLHIKNDLAKQKSEKNYPPPPCNTLQINMLYTTPHKTRIKGVVSTRVPNHRYQTT